MIVSRLLDTGYPHDRVISGDPTNIIWAWGAGSIGFHGANRGTMRNVRFIDSVAAPTALVATPQSYDDSFSWTSPSYAIPNVETTYKEQDWAIPLPNGGNDELHIVGIKISNSHAMLHHVVLNDNNGPLMAFTGDDEMWFTECGFPIGGTSEGAWDGNAQLQIHYDNPTLQNGQIDATTKVEIYYRNTGNKLAEDCGMMTVGDLLLNLDVVPSSPASLPYEMGHIPSDTAFTHRQATCPSECTTKLDQPINFFAGALHMHYYGEKIVLDHYDTSGNLKATQGRSDFWDNGHQYTDPLINFQLQPGESLQLHCGYNTAAHSSNITFDEDTSQEMCQAFLLYWPAKKQSEFSAHGSNQSLNICGMSVISDTLYTLCGSGGSTTGQVGRTASWADPSLFASSVSGSAHSAYTEQCSAYQNGSFGLDDLNDLIEQGVTNLKKIGIGIIIGIVVGGVVLLALLILLCYCCCCRKKNQKVVIVQQVAAPAGQPGVAVAPQQQKC